VVTAAPAGAGDDRGTQAEKGAGVGENVVYFHPTPGAFVLTFFINFDARRKPGRTNL